MTYDWRLTKIDLIDDENAQPYETNNQGRKDVGRRPRVSNTSPRQPNHDRRSRTYDENISSTSSSETRSTRILEHLHDIHFADLLSQSRGWRLETEEEHDQGCVEGTYREVEICMARSRHQTAAPVNVTHTKQPSPGGAQYRLRRIGESQITKRGHTISHAEPMNLQ